jgi:hypothetical protein
LIAAVATRCPKERLIQHSIAQDAIKELSINLFNFYSRIKLKKESTMRCNVCNGRIKPEDAVPVSTAQKFSLEPFEYSALVCEDCVEDVFELDLI